MFPLERFFFSGRNEKRGGGQIDRPLLGHVMLDVKMEMSERSNGWIADGRLVRIDGLKVGMKARHEFKVPPWERKSAQDC